MYDCSHDPYSHHRVGKLSLWQCFRKRLSYATAGYDSNKFPSVKTCETVSLGCMHAVHIVTTLRNLPEPSDSKIRPWVPRGSERRIIVLARAVSESYPWFLRWPPRLRSATGYYDSERLVWRHEQATFLAEMCAHCFCSCNVCRYVKSISFYPIGTFKPCYQ
jgi:hypothetical protein